MGLFFLISLGGALLASQIVAWTVPGLEGEAAQLAAISTRLSFAGTAFFALGGASRGIINSYHQFVLPTAAPGVGNVFTIAAIVALARISALAGAIGLAVGQFAGWALQTLDLIRKGIFPFSLSWYGSAAALNFADRLRQVPLGLFAVALTTAVLSNLSEIYARGIGPALPPRSPRGCWCSAW